MIPSDHQPNSAPDVEFTRPWRYKVGFTKIIAGNLGIHLAYGPKHYEFINRDQHIGIEVEP